MNGVKGMSKYRRSISLLLAIFMVFGALTAGALAVEDEIELQSSFPFTDVPSGSWFAGAVWYAYQNGIMTGTSPTTFAPNAPFTRAMVVTTLFRIHHGRPANASDSRSNPFTDVTTQWFAPYVTWAYNNGVTDGIGAGLFGPQNNVTRQQFATMLFRYADRMTDRDMTIRQSAQWNAFTDRGQIASWAVDALTWANYHGIISGRTTTTIAPTGTATRAEAATMLMRFIEGPDFVPPAPPEPPAPDFGAPQIIYYNQGVSWEDIPYSINGEEVTAQQFEAEMNRIYAGARYRLVSYRSIPSEDSNISSASGAIDVFMTRSEAIARLGNETAQWASAYRAILNGIPTGVHEFVQYGVRSVSLHDLTGNSIPDLIFTTATRGQPMRISFSVYSFDGSAARRIIHIDPLEFAGVSSPYYHAYFTNNGRLIVNNNNTGFGRIHIFGN